MSGDGSTTVVVSTETVSETVNEDSNLNFRSPFSYSKIKFSLRGGGFRPPVFLGLSLYL